MPCALCAVNLRQTKEALKMHLSVPSKLQSSFHRARGPLLRTLTSRHAGVHPIHHGSPGTRHDITPLLFHISALWPYGFRPPASILAPSISARTSVQFGNELSGQGARSNVHIQSPLSPCPIPPPCHWWKWCLAGAAQGRSVHISILLF